MSAAWWGAITGSLSLVLVLVREWLSFFPIVRLAPMNGYETENPGADHVDDLRLVGGWYGIRVKNWGSRPVELTSRGLALHTGETVLFVSAEIDQMVTTVGPWASYTFRVPLGELLAVPGIDSACGWAVPYAMTTEDKIIKGPRGRIVGDDMRFPRAALLTAVAGLSEGNRVGQPVWCRPGVYAITESFAPGIRSGLVSGVSGRRSS